MSTGVVRRSPHASALRLILAFPLLMLLAPCTLAGSIFDDDWTPPKQPDRARPAVPKPAAPAPPAPKATAPSPTPSPAPSPTAVPDAPPVPLARRAVPGKADQIPVRKLLKDVYADQLGDRSPPARRRLAQTLVDQADKSAATPVDQFVLLTAALDAAAEAADLPLALTVAARVAAAFDVDDLALKAEAVARLNAKAIAPDSAAANVNAALGLIDQLLAADDYAAATRLCAAVRTWAPADPDLRARALERQRQVAAAREAYDRVAREAEKLRAAPDDPAANLAVGRYACLVKQDWALGLPMLAKGSDPTLKSLAARESAGTPDADSVTRLADGWWDAAAKLPDAAHRTSMLAHAATLYQRALGDAQGLRRVQIEKRIAEAARAVPPASPSKALAGSTGVKRPVNLLRLIDPARDGVNGEWSLTPAGLTSGSQANTRLAIPYDPPDEYDLHVAFTRNENKETVSAIISRAGHTVSVVFWGNKLNWGMQNVDGKERWANQTTGKRDVPFKNGQVYDVDIRVRKDAVTVYFDREQCFSLKTDFSNLRDAGQWAIRGAPLGIGAHPNSVTFSAIDLTEVSGPGKPATYPAR